MPTVEVLRHELEEAFRNRAHLYRLMLEELTAELGSERAEVVMARILERRGREVAPLLFAGLEGDAIAVGQWFLSVSPDGGRMYPNEAHYDGDRCTFRVARCPLKDAWQEAGLSDSEVATLCRLAGAFDRGLFEAAGVEFANETWSAARGGGCCWITLSPSKGN
ncbi:MAG: L-2-amino-thiazoline-4-carboxylic acid hydrolase [Beijerinckiaceae bacterium]